MIEIAIGQADPPTGQGENGMSEYTSHNGPAGTGIVVHGRNWEVWDDCVPDSEPIATGSESTHEAAIEAARNAYHKAFPDR